ncbi:hypothetical protein FRB90_008581 [Tulasnella sp. 427]|nr:hypothetical protein FRB90_008581 [Tulasnella sp. 427]
MYTSYTDFSAWDQFFASAALDQTLAGVGSDPSLMAPANLGGNGANRMEDLLSSTDNFSELIPFSSFSPNQGASTNANGAGMMTGVSTANSPIDRSTSTGQQLVQPQASNAAFTLASRESAASANRPSLPVRSSSPCGGADPDEAPLPGSSHHNPSMSSMNVSKPNTEQDGSQCPKTKDDLAKLIEGQPLSTLGSVAGIPQAKQSFSEKKTMRLKEVWNALKNHPRFDEVDMDELCRELSSKVKCDGGMPGVDESDKPCEELGRIIDAVKAKKAEEAKAAQQVNQQQRVIQSISTGGLGDNSMSQSPPTATAPANNNNNPAALSNFSLFGSSPYNSYLPFAMPPQSAGSTTSQFTTMTPHSATAADFGGFDSRRPSLGGAHNNSGSTDATSFMSGGSSSVATPQSASSGMGFAQSGATDPWLAGAFEMPPPTSPNSQFLSFLSGNAGGFSPNSYLNLPDKE